MWGGDNYRSFNHVRHKTSLSKTILSSDPLFARALLLLLFARVHNSPPSFSHALFRLMLFSFIRYGETCTSLRDSQWVRDTYPSWGAFFTCAKRVRAQLKGRQPKGVERDRPKFRLGAGTAEATIERASAHPFSTAEAEWDSAERLADRFSRRSKSPSNWARAHGRGTKKSQHVSCGQPSGILWLPR